MIKNCKRPLLMSTKATIISKTQQISNVGKDRAWHAQIRQVMTVGTFDFFTWTDAEFQWVISILPYMLLFLHNLHFIFEKPAMKIKIDTYNFLISIYTPLQVCIHFPQADIQQLWAGIQSLYSCIQQLNTSIQPYTTCIDQP